MMLVILANIVGALFASAVNMYAAAHTKAALRTMFIAIAVLAMGYMLSYTWLAFNIESAEEWSAFMRPVGIATWIVAWCIEPLLLVQYNRQLKIDAKIIAKNIQVSALTKLDGLRVD